MLLVTHKTLAFCYCAEYVEMVCKSSLCVSAALRLCLSYKAL